MKGTSCVAAAVAALLVVPIASADRVVSVGYRMPTALHGLHIVSRVPALRTAEVRLPSLRAERALRSRPGIRYVQRTVSRVQAGAPSVPFSSGLSVPEWQWTAVHADLVPTWVKQAARNITIAIVDTGADVLAPSLAAKSPVTWDIVNGVSTVHDVVGHGTFVASLAGGTTSDPAGMSGFGGEARLMIVQANRGGAGFSDIDEANAIVWAVNHGANIINLSLGGAQTSLVERNAIDYATQRGVLLVAAAGNSAEQGNPTVYPAALLGAAGLVVGASSAAGCDAGLERGVRLRHRDVIRGTRGRRRSRARLGRKPQAGRRWCRRHARGLGLGPGHPDDRPCLRDDRRRRSRPAGRGRYASHHLAAHRRGGLKGPEDDKGSRRDEEGEAR
jgi:hypothetical protein